MMRVLTSRVLLISLWIGCGGGMGCTSDGPDTVVREGGASGAAQAPDRDAGDPGGGRLDGGSSSADGGGAGGDGRVTDGGSPNTSMDGGVALGDASQSGTGAADRRRQILRRDHDLAPPIRQ